MSIDRRMDRRILVGPDHLVRFLLGAREFRHVRVTNISQGGCFITLHDVKPEDFPAGHLLEDFTFEHHDLPHKPFTARVAFSIGFEHDEEDLTDSPSPFIGVGIQFLLPPADIEDGLAHFMADYV